MSVNNLTPESILLSSSVKDSWFSKPAISTNPNGGARITNEGCYNYPAKTIYKSSKPSILPGVIAFDLDETIGSFSDFHSLWYMLEDEMKTQDVFNDIMNLYPEFLRVGIVSVLSFIQKKKDRGHCLPIYIYTNNQCEDPKWVDRLIHYLELCVGTGSNLFAKPICAFKIRNNFVQPGRTTHEKTYSDFVRCSMIKSENLCFIDDSYHEKMKHHKVYYIQPPPYIHKLSKKEVMDRFMNSEICKRLYPENMRTMNIFAGVSAGKLRDPSYYEKEKNVTNKIMYYIREFFFICSKKNKTKKRRSSRTCRFSRKRHILV